MIFFPQPANRILNMTFGYGKEIRLFPFYQSVASLRESLKKYWVESFSQ